MNIHLFYDKECYNTCKLGCFLILGDTFRKLRDDCSAEDLKDTCNSHGQTSFGIKRSLADSTLLPKWTLKSGLFVCEWVGNGPRLDPGYKNMDVQVVFVSIVFYVFMACFVRTIEQIYRQINRAKVK